jgi:choline-phosphate cytidylyltransferase
MVGLLSIEVRVSAVAHRPLHSAVICIIVCSLGSAVFGLVSAVLYVVGMLTDLAYSTGTPLFVPVRNVYIDGVYDLCHIGHKRLMEYALSHGNRLIVGVMSDEECIKYKRKPIMTTEERCREVASCKWVSQVIPDCPPSGIPADFIKKYNIHVVVYGEEYEKPDDKYYAVPRAMGIGRIAPRTKGISTSEIIRRIANASQEELVAKDKASGASTVKE